MDDSGYMLDFGEDDLDSGKERVAVDEGEYTVRIRDFKADDDGKIKLADKNGMPFMMPILEIVNCEEAEYSKDIRHYLALPHPDLEKKKANDVKFQLAQFFKAFGIDYSQPIDPEECIGLEAEALLVVDPDAGYGEGNRVKRWITSP